MIKALSVDDLVTHINIFSKTDMTSSEANTKNRIIEPLLEILGWDLLSNEVRLEYPLKIGTATAYVDYALMLEGKPVVLVEGKAFDVTLSDDHSSQIISYGRIEDVQWVVLTNGRILKVFDAEAGRTESECLVVEVDLEKLPQQASDLRLISRESILTGEIEEAARRLATTKKALSDLKQRQKELAEEIKKALLKITGTEVKNRVENISSQLAKEAIQLFEKKVEVPIYPPKGEIPILARKDLAEKVHGEVVICPSKIEGVEFLKKYNAWGFVNLSKARKPRYFALYVGKPESSVLYFGEIESITPPLKSKEDLMKIQEEDVEMFETGKRVIHLKPGTLMKFTDPIPLKNKRKAPRGLRYTTLEKIMQAKHVEDL